MLFLFVIVLDDTPIVISYLLFYNVVLICRYQLF